MKDVGFCIGNVILIALFISAYVLLYRKTKVKK